MAKEAKTYKHTFDLEGDWGGRLLHTQGIKDCIPIILHDLKINNIQAIFFVSGEIARECTQEVRVIQKEGHVIGSHGMFHVDYKNYWRAETDRLEAEHLLKDLFDLRHEIPYRAPKFSHQVLEEPYSLPTDHCSLLKAMWLKPRLSSRTVFYTHPFDILKKPTTSAPTLFCKLWYSQPKRAYRKFKELLSRFHGERELR